MQGRSVDRINGYNILPHCDTAKCYRYLAAARHSKCSQHLSLVHKRSLCEIKYCCACVRLCAYAYEKNNNSRIHALATWESTSAVVLQQILYNQMQTTHYQSLRITIQVMKTKIE